MVTDAHGCKDSANVNVNSTSVPTLSITSKGSLCSTPSVDTLIASITGASSYVWAPGLGSSNYTYTVSTSGLYSLSVVINGCSVSATYSLSPPITPTVNVGGNFSLCSGDSTMVNVSAVPAGNYSYAWYNGSSIIGTNSTQTIYTTGNYSVAAINNNTQCKSAQVFTVNSYTNPVVSINGNQTYCKSSLFPDSLTAVVSGGNAPYNYSWSPSSPTVTTYTYAAMPPSNATSITYSVIVTDSKGCKAVAQILLKQSNPHLAIANPSVCPGYTIGVTANGSGTAPLTYTWTDLANGQQVIGKHNVLAPGKYTVVMTDVYGCSVTDTVKVGLNAVPNANFSYAPQSVEQGSPVTFTNGSTITTGSITSNSWTFGDTSTAQISNPTHIYNSGGSFSVSLIVKSDKGCLDTLTEILTIQYNVIAPNIITPNGDGINEMLAFKNLQYFKNNKLQIFNRWGTRLYQDTDYKNNWSGKDYSDGTYFYILEIPDKHKTLNGFFENVK
jgi:gliding motility-associated-like protein